MQDQLFVIAIGYSILLSIWLVSVWFLYEESSMILQKALLVIPAFKLMRVLIYGMYIGECPWKDQLTARYLMMALVTVSTIYQTVFVALLLLISKGWVLMRGNLSRSQATSTTMLMGAVYLTYSAYYVSVSANGVKNFIGMILNVLYICIFVIVLRNSVMALRILKLHYTIISQNEVASLQESVMLKIGMMRKFIVIASAYFVFEILIHGIVPLLKSEDDFDPLTIILH